MKPLSYKQPPITEAVIEIKFVTTFDPVRLDEANKKFAKNYPQHQAVKQQLIKINLPNKEQQGSKATAQREESVGHRRSDPDVTQLLLALPSSFIVSQLAPYSGWEAFFKRFVRDWNVWKRVMGHNEIARIGVRYINRIDIPVVDNVARFEDYLNYYPHTPTSLDPVLAYAIQTENYLSNIDCKLTINSAVVEAPILDHMSFVVDQDISREFNPPQKDSEIMSLLEQIRLEKNRIFEACITDKARARFQQI